MTILSTLVYRERCADHPCQQLANKRRNNLLYLWCNYCHKLMCGGSFPDIPVREIVHAFKKAYGEDRVQGWIDSFNNFGEIRRGRFDVEDVVKS
jgi:hypothetical protein